MSGRNRSLVVAALLLQFVALAAQLGAADDELKAFQGTWKPTEANLGDNKIDALVLESASIVYENDKYTLTIGDKVETGALKLAPDKSPKQIDIFPTSGPNNGSTVWAIYKFDGDALQVCYSLTPNVRPESFDPDSNTLLFVRWERVKE